MAIGIAQAGKTIATEKLVITAVTDNAPTVTTVVMEIYINSNIIASTLEHLPDFGTTTDFSFEINSIVKDYFENDFLALTGPNQTASLKALIEVQFFEVHDGVIQPTAYNRFVVVSNITQDVFEIEYFDITDYNCGDTGSTASKLLTSSPSTLPIGDLTSVHVSCFSSSYSGTTPTFTPKQEWTIETYLNGVFVAQTTESVDVPNRSLPNFASSAKFDTSNYRIDFDSSNGYNEVRIYIRDIAGPNTQRSETKVFKLNDACDKSLTLSWHNEFGVQDSFTFLGNINRVGKYTDSTFKRARPVNPLSTDVGDLVYKSSYNYQYDLFSDRMPENTVQWLSKMLINKRAAIQDQGGKYLGGALTTQLTSPVVGVNQYGLPVDGGNGFMYVPPLLANDILKINIATGVITSFGSFPAAHPKWFSTEIAPNGKIYCIPFFDDDVLVIDPATDTTATLVVPTSTGLFQKWKTSAITSSGVIYCPPSTGVTSILKIDTSTDTVTEFGAIADTYNSCALSSNGFIYCFTVPTGKPFLKINTSTDATSTFGTQGTETINSSRSFELGGFIYGFGVTDIYKINILTDAVTTISNASVGIPVGWGDTMLGLDGNFYFVPSLNDDLVVYNPITNAAIVLQSIETAPEWFAVGMSSTGVMYGIPNKTNEVLEIQLKQTTRKYFPIVIETEDTVLEDKFSPETIFRIKFRMANRRKGLK